jgi:hypothetical protein
VGEIVDVSLLSNFLTIVVLPALSNPSSKMRDSLSVFFNFLMIVSNPIKSCSFFNDNTK